MPISIRRSLTIKIGDRNTIGNYIKGDSEREAKQKTKNYLVKVKTQTHKSSRG